MTDVLPDNVKKAALNVIPMKKMGTAQDVANAVAFLASDQAGYISGQVLCVDGGMAM
jgi:3-oxoacyl-[acyl-carrier protein] reductase